MEGGTGPLTTIRPLIFDPLALSICSSSGLTLSSKAALGPAVSALGSWLGTLNGFNLLGAPAAALTVSPLAGN